ncbi:hypothetical protein DSO57_1019268 [Entomophthora muscae]|uniref:Uncharacterized protein n=1 Tax=Entomophthora muscae TaxID=34485 RepID=A0ACC2RIL3_9FUNG|nr:hypothetical protein DSO57_1019268 [Entomophthora muscae]
MDFALEEVTKLCKDEFQKFSMCLEKNQNDMSKCNAEKLQIRRCAIEKVEIVRVTRDKCEKVIQVYDACLKSNPDDAYACIQQLRAVKDCVDAFEKEGKSEK